MWAALILMLTSTAVANPSCVMLTFTDDTRYDRVNVEGRRCVIEIDEFSSAIEGEYLSLPTALKDVTKRKKEG